jgi:hypothetical protein
MAPFGQQLNGNPVIHPCRDAIVKMMAREMDISRKIALGGHAELLKSTEWQCLQEISGELCSIRLLNRLLKAEQERKQQLVQMITPIKGLLESMQLHTRDMARVAQASAAPSHRMVEANALAAIRTINSLTALSDLHAPVRIHALPRLPVLDPPRLGPCREDFSERTPPRPVPEAPSQPAPKGWLEDNLDAESGQRVLEQLSRFVRSEEIPSDAREGMSVLITWWKLNRLRITPDQSLSFNRIVQSFIGAQLGLATATDDHKQLNSGLFVPLGESLRPRPAVELDPRIYTSLELSRILNYNDSTIRRQAETAWRRAGGIGPCPLRRGSNWYVVEAAEDGGGQKRGWKFQQLLETQES